MNNPYRARPGRQRVDHAAVSNYGVQNQNSWGSMSGSSQSVIPSAAGFPAQNPVANQSKQAGDPWDWGSENNGNDAWNWSVDQQPDSNPIPQQQQQPQQHQPPQFVPSNPNNMQIPPNPSHESYYKNLNGNNRNAPSNNQAHQGSGSNTPRSGPSREPTPQLSEGYSNYTKYSTNQQRSVPSRPNSAKTSNTAAGNDYSQWPPNQQQQKQSRIVDHAERQAPPFNPYFQTNPLNLDAKGAASTLPPHQPVVNNYNWNSANQSNIPVQQKQQPPPQPQNWQNHSEVSPSGYWQDNANIETESPYKCPDNQWQQQPRHSQTPQNFVTVSNVPSVQWQSQSRDANQSNQRSQMPLNSHVLGAASASWNKSESLSASQSWQQVPLQGEVSADQWSQQQGLETPSNLAEATPTEEIVPRRVSSKEWSQIKPSLAHFASSTVSTASGSIPNLSSGADANDEQKKSLATSVASSMSRNDSPTDGKAPTLYQAAGIVDRGNWTAASETNSISDNSENILVQENADVDWQANGEWASRSVNNLATSIGQISLGSGKSSQQQEPQAPSAYPAYAIAQQISQAESAPNLQPSVRNTLDNAQLESHAKSPLQDPPTHAICPPNAVNAPEALRTNYDQWYNQNATQPQQGVGWYTNDRPRAAPQQWAPEQNVENYENIQQPTEFVNLEVVTPVMQERDIYGSRDSINKETLDNDPKPLPSLPKDISVDSRQEISNVEVLTAQQVQQIQPDQAPDNYEFASNDRNTFLETGELTDSHQEQESIPPSQDDENDEVPSDIPFLREVPGQSSSADPRRNDPTGQEQYVQSSPRVSDPRRNDPSGQLQGIPARNLSERRDVPPGQERSIQLLSRGDSETFERRNDPSGRERSLPPAQSRNDPSGEERTQTQQPVTLEPGEVRQVPGSGANLEESLVPTDSGLRQIPGGASPNEAVQIADDRNNTRVVTGSQEVGTPVLPATMQDSATESRNKREEAVGASVGETPSIVGPPNRRDSYEDGDDEGSGNSRDENRERRRDGTPTGERRRYDYDRKGPYYDRDREYDDGYYYDRRRGPDYDRSYNSREDLDRRDATYREGERRHISRDDLDRHPRDDPDRRGRLKDDIDERDGRRRVDDRRRDRVDNPRRRDREGREFDPRYALEYPDRERRRDDRRPRRYDDYDPRDPLSRREYYEDPYARSSRPSSRSSYNDRERDYYMRARDPYYSYNAGYNGYDYGTTYNRDYYAYFENLRRSNPAAYSEWYHKYYANQHQQVPRGVSNYQEDRASVHSGRSSCEDRFFANSCFCYHALNKSLYVSRSDCPGFINSPLKRRRFSCQKLDRTTTSEKRTLNDLSVLEDSRVASSRLTPTKFSTSHVIGSLSIGSLLHVHACYPADGERAKVDIIRMDYHLMNDPVARELRAYPGPLIKQVGVTHKKTIIEYCESKIKKAAVNDELLDKASYVLLYQLMIMLIQQNGNVVGVDIAQLLLRNKEAHPYNATKPINESVRRESTISQRSSGTGGDGSAHEGVSSSESVEPVKQRKTVEQMTDEFRNTLLYGLVQEALEYAMTEGLWGHALFLASKLDKRTHASVMTRFANSLPIQDPLQTLYQLHSGRVPASVTCVSDPKWDDWRPHLAMIISNTSANPEINRRSITNLGDTLAARGDIHAAHFCYILAQIDFGPYGAPAVKLVLIGSNHSRPYADFVTPEAIMLTEIYEYARHLSEPGFTLVDLQTFKFESALKMVDYGLTEKALLYLEQIATNIINDPAKYKASFINQVYTLGDRIKYHDPVCKDSVEDATSLAWLNNLAKVVARCQAGEIEQQEDVRGARRAIDSLSFATQDQEHHEPHEQSRLTGWRDTVYSEGLASLMDVPSGNGQPEWQPLSLPGTVPDPYDNGPEHAARYTGGNLDSSQYNQSLQQDYWNQQNYAQQDYQTQDYTTGDWQHQANQSQFHPDQTEADSSQQQQGTWNYEPEKEEKPATPEPQPTISMGPTLGNQYDPLEELDALEPPRDASMSPGESKKSTEKGSDKKNTNAGGSWFGGLFSKLTPKPKNQMILPDDNNPTIVWDPVAKKWANKNEDGDSSSPRLAPPPKASDMGFKPTIVQPPAAPQQPPQLSLPVDHATTPSTAKVVAGNNMFKMPKGRNMRANYIDVMNPGGNKATGVPSNIPTPATSPLVPMATSSPQLFIPAPVNDPAAPVDFLTSTVPGVPAASSENANQVGPTLYNPTDVKNRSLKNTPRSRYPPR